MHITLLLGGYSTPGPGLLFGFLTLEYVTESLSRNVDKELQIYAAELHRRVQISGLKNINLHL